MNTTTKRFARSLAEAFPDERASAGTHYRSTVHPCEWVVLALAVVCIGGAAVAHFLARFA